MARFLLWNDLHDEFWQGLDWPDLDLKFDAVLIAGDLTSQGRHVDLMAQIYACVGVPVRMVRGNHEFYNAVIEDVLAEDERKVAFYRSAGIDIAVLDRDVDVIAGVRIIGATLWTDLALYPGSEPEIRQAVAEGMNDFRTIQRRTEAGAEALCADHWVALHQIDRAFVLEALAQPFEGKSLVMSHHLPCRELIHPKREMRFGCDYMMNGGYASDLWRLIRSHHLHTWVFGHSHDAVCLDLEGVRFRSNPRGYDFDTCRFDPNFIIEI